MFGLFKKKEAEKGPDALSAPQHPAAAALSAQFAPDEFDILAVTGPSGFDGDRAGEEYWTVTLPLTAWKEEGGPVHRENTCLVALADDKVLPYLRRLAPRDSIIQARVRQGLEDDRFLLAGTPAPVMDRELKVILDEQVKPVSTWVPELGTFVLNRTVGWYQMDADWLGQSVQLVYDQGSEEEMQAAQETAKALMSRQEEWDGRVRAYAVQQLAARCADGDAALSSDELARRLEPESVQTRADGSFEFWFHDAEYLWQHAVRVSGTLEGGPDDVGLDG